jgi:hypothetical protein
MSGLMMRIDLLAIDLEAGKHFMDRVHDENLARKVEAIRRKNREAWLARRRHASTPLDKRSGAHASTNAQQRNMPSPTDR